MTAAPDRRADAAEPAPGVGERLFVASQHVLPKRALTEAAGALARHAGGAATTAAIRRFVARYRVDLAEAAEPDPAAYATFNDFFTRALRPGARPLADADWICPVDGAVSQRGAIDAGRIVQAKGRHYDAAALLGGPGGLGAAAADFAGGSFATIYLSPRDYHRIHMPARGRLRAMAHVPGTLYSVNPATARGVERLFARNERVACLFDGDDGRPFALVLVGATIVGSMAVVWHGVVNPPRRAAVKTWRYDAPGHEPVVLGRGAEMGRFLLGSTVVLLWPAGDVRFADGFEPGAPVRLGQAMAVRPRG